MCGFKIKMFFKTIFTWWNKYTIGTFLKTLFSGIYVGKDNFGNKYYKNKKDERWVVYSSEVENKTGTENSYKPVKIKKDQIEKKYETWK